MEKVRFVVASRASEADFYEKTATGRSLRLYNFPFLDVRLFPANSTGLPKLYNSVIKDCVNDPCTLIFAHDDLHILDFYWVNQIATALKRFQIVGVAGNTRRLPRQPSWAFIDTTGTWDSQEHLSGIVGHGTSFPPENLSIFGPVGQPVKLLDGLLLAAESSTFTANGLRFDERFDFHFYDIDLCRQAEQKNITCGTWPLSLIHESAGNYASQAWKDAYATYLAKWGE